MPRLKITISSIINGFCYGRAGDEIKIIADHGNVFIVENDLSNRFSVVKENIEFDEETKIEASGNDKHQHAKNPAPKKNHGKKNTKPIENTNQQSLF